MHTGSKADTAQAVSSTNTYYSAWTSGAEAISWLNQFVGTMAGTLSVEVTNSPKQDRDNGVAKVGDYQLATSPASPAGADVNIPMDVVMMGQWAAVRAKYINSSGSGTWTPHIGTGQN